MTFSIDEEINVMIKKLAVDLNDLRTRSDLLYIIDNYLTNIKPEGWKAFIHGSAAHGLATKNDSIDICVTNIYANQTPITSTSANNLNLMKQLNNHLLYYHKKRSYDIVELNEALNIPFSVVKESFTSIEFNISIDNKLDIERTNLVTEYLCLDKRVKPFLFALKQFIKNREINNEKNGYPNSYVFIMMGLYFLMFVQDSPVIPCLHSMPVGLPCDYPVCRSKRSEKVLGFDIKYHDCADTDRIVDIDPPQYSHLKSYEERPWASKNTKSVSDLLIEVFRWFSSSTAVLKPKSINSKESPVIQPGWESNAMVFVDVFNSKLNIAASCTATRVKIINKEFNNAYIMLKTDPNFEKLLEAPETVPKPIALNLHNYTRGCKHALP